MAVGSSCALHGKQNVKEMLHPKTRSITQQQLHQIEPFCCQAQAGTSYASLVSKFPS